MPYAPERSALSQRHREQREWRSRVVCGPARPPIQLSGWFVPVSPRTCHRAAMPCRNSSGNVASDASSTPSARNPFQVNATDTHFFQVDGTGDRLCRRHLSRMACEPSAPLSGLLKRKKFISPGQCRHACQQDVLDIVELEHQCSQSGERSMTLSASRKPSIGRRDLSLHLVKHCRQGAFTLSAFFISSAVTNGYSPYSRKLGH